MLYRKISARIENYFTNPGNRMLMINGARQIGKSYIIRTLGKKFFPNYIEINMEEDKLGKRIFANSRTTSDFYIAMSLIGGDKMKEKENTLVFIDEIQSYDHLLTLVKFLIQDDRFTYIASGSLSGIALKNTQSVPMGSIDIVNMYPMDFEEFLYANSVGEIALDAMKNSFGNMSALPEYLHDKIMDLFKKYLIVGGLPKAVDTFVKTKNITQVRSIQNEVHQLYKVDCTKYEEDNKSILKVRRIYDMIPSILENKKKRMVIRDIENKKWKRSDDYLEDFDYLIAAGVTLEVKAVSTPTYPLIGNSGKNLLKLYLNDVGILSAIYYGTNINAIMSDHRSIDLGAIYETVVAQELKAHGFNLFYYDNKKNGEVDFLIDDNEFLSNIPIEVKSGKDYSIHSALTRFLSNQDYNIEKAYVLSNEREIYEKDKVIYIPIYYIMFFQKDPNSADVFLY